VTPLSNLLQASRNSDSEVARRREAARSLPLRVVCWEEFRQDVAGLRDRLDDESDGGWLLACDDAYVFAVGLFGLWHSGRHAILPPNEQPGTLRLLEGRSAGVLCDSPDWPGEHTPISPLKGTRSTRPALLTPLDREAVAVEIYTSGTTQEERPVPKRVRHLEDEVAGLASLWDPMVGSALVFSTASHRHLYGLLFGVLWPLVSGRSFHAGRFLHVDELLKPMLDTEESVLASVPTTLRRLASHTRAEDLASRCCAIFSSGGPLARETALRLEATAGRAPLEVLGSTETGGIAWRQQSASAGEAQWTPFDRVEVLRKGTDDLLRVRSPFVSIGDVDAGFATGDRIETSQNGRFLLRGRSDRIVKIGEKRLDLDKLAAELRRHECVDDVALVTLDRETGARIAAAVVPSEIGRGVVEAEGRRELGRRLRTRLAGSFDPVTHPRYWRIVPEIPSNEQGKVRRDAILALFETISDTPDDTPAEAPELVYEFSAQGFAERSCRVPKDLSCFAGHFPSVPVVPAVLQLDWAIALAYRLVAPERPVAEVESLKLKTRLLPGDRFQLQVRVVDENRVDFQLANEEFTHASGRIRFESLSAGPS
jgi:acyl-CoA synthetase (AMP-forming)/AMP-acid ligase II/3-hydroxymyristoyl/3-hydroxydecanoyl-(acyl carrier protein) dehydratase